MTEQGKVSAFKNLPKVIARSFREIKAELKKVIWPTPQQLFTSTTAVIAACIAMGLIIWVFDTGLTVGLERFILGQ